MSKSAIDFKSRKLLRYIKRNPNLPLGLAYKYTKNFDYNNPYVVTLSNNKFLQYDIDNNGDWLLSISPEGDEYLREHRKSSIKTIVEIMAAIAAIVGTIHTLSR